MAHFKVTVVLVFSGALFAASWFVQRQNALLRARVPDATRQRIVAAQLHTENERLRDLVTRATTDAADAAAALHRRRGELEAEVATLERKAQDARAKQQLALAADAESLANNYDPSKGLVRVENLQNVGQATPSAALQTLVWAAYKGDDATLAKVVVLDANGLAAADALLAKVPPDAQPSWTVARLTNLCVTDAVTNLAALQIVDERLRDPEHAIVTIRRPGGNETIQPYPFEHGPDGWRLVLPPEAFAAVGRRLTTQDSNAPHR